MQIAIIGSTSYKDKMIQHKDIMEQLGHRVHVPCLDDHPEMDELQICEQNKKYIQTCDEVHVLWDGRSVGTIFDFGMAFAFNKPLKLIYVNQKTVLGLFEKYEAKHKRKKSG